MNPLRIGELEIPPGGLLAPMAGYANLPFRRLCKELACAFVTTEMVSAEGLVRQQPGTEVLLADHPGDRPRAVQLFGADPELVAAAARIVAARGLADVIDLNMGCPVRKVVSGGSGSALLKEPDRAVAMVRAVRGAMDLPLTVKLRAGWDHKSVLVADLAPRLVEAGADALFLHPRTRAQGFRGTADWTHVRDTVRAVDVPVIGSGDVRSPADVRRRLAETGCAGIQVGRAALGNPLLFARWPTRDGPDRGWAAPRAERLATLARHVELYREFAGDRKAAVELRKHAGQYFRGLPGVSHFRTRAQNLSGCDALLALAGEYFG